MCRHDLKDEVRILLLHGLLHLMGLDHENGPEGAAAMEAAEQAIMQQLGWKVSLLMRFPGALISLHSICLVAASTEHDDKHNLHCKRNCS